MTTWNKTSKHPPRDCVPVIVCHYEFDTPGYKMYQTGGYYLDGGWRDLYDEVMYTPKYWTERLENPE